MAFVAIGGEWSALLEEIGQRNEYKGATQRAILIGLFLVPVNVYWVTIVEMKYRAEATALPLVAETFPSSSPAARDGRYCLPLRLLPARKFRARQASVFHFHEASPNSKPLSKIPQLAAGRALASCVLDSLQEKKQ